MSKYYVRDYTKKNVDDERLQVVRVYPDKPHRFDYLVFIKE